MGVGMPHGIDGGMRSPLCGFITNWRAGSALEGDSFGKVSALTHPWRAFGGTMVLGEDGASKGVEINGGSQDVRQRGLRAGPGMDPRDTRWARVSMSKLLDGD
jgi:hypothetical protein